MSREEEMNMWQFLMETSDSESELAETTRELQRLRAEMSSALEAEADDVAEAMALAA